MCPRSPCLNVLLATVKNLASEDLAYLDLVSVHDGGVAGS